MPNANIPAPESTSAVDRLSLSSASVRGSLPQGTGACCFPCMCCSVFDVEASAGPGYQFPLCFDAQE